MHEGHRERMREKYLKNGIDALSPHEVLELLLFYSLPRINTNHIAHRLIESFQTFNNVLDADIEALCKVEGMGKNSALLLHLVKDCMNLYNSSRRQKRPELLTAMAAGIYAMQLVGEQSTEGFYVICLDPNRKVLSSKKVLEGSTYQVAMDVRKVVEYILEHKTRDVIFIHNHPLGPIEPSSEDIAVTKRFQEALKPLGIKVIDHIIVGDDCFYSMAAHAEI